MMAGKGRLFKFLRQKVGSDSKNMLEMTQIIVYEVKAGHPGHNWSGVANMSDCIWVGQRGNPILAPKSQSATSNTEA